MTHEHNAKHAANAAAVPDGMTSFDVALCSRLIGISHICCHFIASLASTHENISNNYTLYLFTVQNGTGLGFDEFEIANE